MCNELFNFLFFTEKYSWTDYNLIYYATKFYFEETNRFLPSFKFYLVRQIHGGSPNDTYLFNVYNVHTEFVICI